MPEKKRGRVTSKITQLPADIRSQFDAMLRDCSNTYSEISEWLKSEGHDISRSAVGRHAIRTNQAAQRVLETLEKTKAIAAVVEQDPDIDYTKAARILLMDGLMQRVSTAEEDYSDIPLDKAGRLIASLARVNVYEQKAKRDYKSKMEMALEALESELTAAINGHPELAQELSAVLQKARDQILSEE